MGLSPARQLVYRFCELPHVRQMEVVKALKLDKESDKQLSELEQCFGYIRRAQEKALLAEMWDKINELHDTPMGENPFRTEPMDTHKVIEPESPCVEIKVITHMGFRGIKINGQVIEHGNLCSIIEVLDALGYEYTLKYVDY